MNKNELLKALKADNNYYPDQTELNAAQAQAIADYINDKTQGSFTADEVKTGLCNGFKTCFTRKDWDTTLSVVTDEHLFTDAAYDIFASGRTYHIFGHEVKVKLFFKPTMVHTYDDGSKDYLSDSLTMIWVDGIEAKRTRLNDNLCFTIDCPELNFCQRCSVFNLLDAKTIADRETITETIENAIPANDDGETIEGEDAIAYARAYIAESEKLNGAPMTETFETLLTEYDNLTQNDTAESADNAHETICPTIEICDSICTDEKPQTAQEQFKDLCKRFKAGYRDTAELKPTEEYNCTATDDRGRAKEYMEICNRIGIEKRLMAKFEKEGNTEGVNGCKERILNLHKSEGYIKNHSDWQQENFRIERGQKNLENVEFARALFANNWIAEMDIDFMPLFIGDTKDFINALTGQYFVNIMRDKPTDLIAVTINLVSQSKTRSLLTEDGLLHKFNRWLNYMSTSPNFDPNLDKWETTEDILWDFIDRRRHTFENNRDRYPTNEEIFRQMTNKEEN